MKKFLVVILSILLFTGCSSSNNEPKQLSCTYKDKGIDQTIVFISDQDNLVDKIYVDIKNDAKLYLASGEDIDVENVLKDIQNNSYIYDRDPIKYHDKIIAYRHINMEILRYVDGRKNTYYKNNIIYTNFLVTNIKEAKDNELDEFYGISLDDVEKTIKQKIKREEIEPLDCKLVDGKKYDKPKEVKYKIYVDNKPYVKVIDFEDALKTPVYLRNKYEIVEVDGLKGYLKFNEDNTCDIDLTEFNKSYPAGDNSYHSQECAKTRTPEEYKYEYQKSKCTWSKESNNTLMIKYTGKYNVYRTCNDEVIGIFLEDYYVDNSLNSSSNVSRDYTDIRVDFNDDFSEIEFDYGTKAFMRSNEHSRIIAYKSKNFK